MANGLPYFKWFPKDAETDTLYCRLTDQERGLYHHCLNMAWINGGLPSDLSEMAESLNRPLEYLERVWPRLSKCFSLANGRWVNPRQEKEREKAIALSDKRSSAGKQGGRPQKQLLSKTKANAYEYVSVSEYSEKEGGVGETKVPYSFDEQFLDFKIACVAWGMAVVDPEDFIAAWPDWSKLDGLQRQEAVEGIGRLSESGADPKYAKTPKNYLRGREWKRPILKAKSNIERMMDRI